MKRALLVATLLIPLLATNRAEAQCGASHASCPQQEVTSTYLCPSALTPILERGSRGELGTQQPRYRNINRGCGQPRTATPEPGTAPCTLVKSIAYVESTWKGYCASACGQTGATVISFDCGYGIMQVTSGMAGPPATVGFEPARVAAENEYNVGTGVKILLDKWAATPCVGDNDPDIIEDWYFATWAYNGFGWVNNPNNPNFPSGRAIYRSPSGLTRTRYPYQEIVWGYLHYPGTASSNPLYTAIPVTYPDATQICATTSCRHTSRIPEPTPIHCDACQRRGDFALVSGGQASGSVGAQVTARIRIRNSGESAWEVGKHILVRTGGEAIGPATIALPSAVPVGATIDLDVPVQAASAGRHTTQYGMKLVACAFGTPFTLTFDATAAPTTTSTTATGTSTGGTTAASTSTTGASTTTGTTGGTTASTTGASSTGGATTTSTTGGTGGNDPDGDGYTGDDDCDESDRNVNRFARELCNGKDDDCDNELDEADDGAPLSRECEAPCGLGIQVCSGGNWGACGVPKGRVEQCNGIDDDCNGIVDDNARCTDGARCVEGACTTEGVVEGGGGCTSVPAWQLGGLAVALGLGLRRRRTV